MRRLRKAIDVAVPIVGAVIVFLAVVLISDVDLYTRVFTVLVGVLMIEAGAWNLTNEVLPSERRYVELREEVDDFIGLVRSLNQSALTARERDDEESWARLREVSRSMHESVDRMVELAGKPADGEPTSPPPSHDA